MLHDRRWRLVLTLVLLVAGFLVSLGAHTLSYTVSTEGTTIVVASEGHTFRGNLGSDAPLEIRYYPQERFSTVQILVPDRGPLLNGLAILRRMGRHLSPEPPVYRQAAGTVRRYVHFDPFRGAFTIHRARRELRIDVNVPDDSMESWEEGKKTQAVKLAPPWLRLAFAPLAAAGCLAAILVVLALLAGGPPREPEPLPEAPWARGRAAKAAVFVAGTLLGAAVFHGVFHAMPGFGDEMNYLWQGRIFASGHLSVPEPPHPEFFRVGWMDMFGSDGRIWGFHPPGNAALLAVGWLVGVPWLTVPLVFGGILLATYLLGLEVLGSPLWALANVLVVATSHYVLSLSSSYMAHAPSDLALALFFLFLLRFVRGGGPRVLLLAAACAGFAFTVRPMSAVLAAVVPILVVFWKARRRVSARTWALAAALGLAVASLVFLYTWGITGRFTLPYAIKGPEVGQTVWVRLTKGSYVHATNFFRNVNEFQHRVHSFGAVGNVLFFVLPLVAAAARLVPLGGALALAYATFASFVVGHSVLHWYGWKWEPRMLFDVSFLFFLGTAAGLQRLARLLPATRAARPAFRAAAAAVLLFVVLRDLPWRFATEYHDYNLAPPGVREAVRRQGIRNAVIFFGAEKAYACYTPANSVGFDGDVVYAREQGDLYDYLLLERFPKKRAYFTPDGNALVPKPNFYRKDLATLREDLRGLEGPTAVVMPWLSVAPTPLNEVLGDLPEDPGRFLGRLAATPARPLTAVFLEGAVELAKLADLSYETQTPKGTSAYEGPIAFRRLGARRPGAGNRFPGIWMTCREGTTWTGSVLSTQIVSSLDIGVCPGENRSLTFETQFELKAPRKMDFVTESDDGSGVLVDGKLVVDNDLANTHGAETKGGTIGLASGVHTLLVKYFNGPGTARLVATLKNAGGKPVPISVAGFLDEFSFFVTQPKEPARGR